MTDFVIPAVRGESIRNRGGCRASAERGPGCKVGLHSFSEDDILVDWSKQRIHCGGKPRVGKLVSIHHRRAN